MIDFFVSFLYTLFKIHDILNLMTLPSSQFTFILISQTCNVCKLLQKIWYTNIKYRSGGKGMKLVCIGDSLTYGYGVSSKSCWTELLKKYLNTEVINKGINGDTTFGILSRSYKDIIEEKPDYVIIMAGTNDILMDRPLKSVKDNIKLLINETKEKNIIPVMALQPPIIPELAKIYWDEKVNYEKAILNLSDYIDWVKEYCEAESITIVNFYDCFLNQNNISSLYSDGIHPNAEGHKLMFSATQFTVHFLNTAIP